MPNRWVADDEYAIIRDLLDVQRGHGVALGGAQVPQPAKDRLVIGTNGQPATWQLSAIPLNASLGSSVNLSVNGLELDEATDYSVDYTTGIVTFSAGQQALFKATPTPADVVTADYWTTGDLIAFSALTDFGGAGDPTSFQIVSNGAQLGASPPTLATFDNYTAWLETGRTLNDVTAVVRNIPAAGNITVCCSVGNVNVGRVAWIGLSVASGTLGYTVSSSTGAGGSGPLASVSSFPATVRCAINSSGVLTIYLNGSSVGTFNVASSVPSAWTDLQGATKVGFQQNAAGNSLESFQTTDGLWSDSFNRADQQGLGVMDTGQIWSYNP